MRGLSTFAPGRKRKAFQVTAGEQALWKDNGNELMKHLDFA